MNRNPFACRSYGGAGRGRRQIDRLFIIGDAGAKGSGFPDYIPFGPESSKGIYPEVTIPVSGLNRFRIYLWGE
jgi:hypothetical protein